MHDEDAARFTSLVSSPIRTPAREQALRDWQTYKLGRQAAHIERQKRNALERSDGWTKGDYIKSVTAQAIDLRDGEFTDVCVGYADIRGVCLDGARFLLNKLPWRSLKGSNLHCASLRHMDLSECRLMECDLRRADLSGCNLQNADFSDANLGGAILSGCDLRGADLSRANLVGADLDKAILDGARVYGVSAWDLRGEPASSRNLVLTEPGSPDITTDDIQIAQFVYLLMDNPRIRNVLDTVTRKLVLILGRFTPQRKALLDQLRDALRTKNLVPILFDFDKGADRDITETVTLLARMARFVIADLTDPASIPQELHAIAPHLSVPISLIIEQGQTPYSMVRDLAKYHWVLKPYRYANAQSLLSELDVQVIAPAEAKRAELARSQPGSDW